MKNKETILVLDDDNIELILIKSVLEDNYNVITCNNASEAFIVLNTTKIDLAIIDIIMPDVDGFSFTRQLLSDENHKKIPFIYITSKDSNNSLKEAFELGAKDFIQKPFNKEKLIIRISNILKTIKLEKEIIRKEEFYETILNMQSNMIAVVKSETKQKDEIIFANNTFLNFFGFDYIEELKKTDFDVSQRFITLKNFFNVNEGDKDWINKILNINEYERNVAFYSKKNDLALFRVSITIFNNNEYILSFTNITNTLKSKFDLEEKVSKDKLTLAYTREYFYQNIMTIKSKNDLNNNITALCFFDIDHFKHINDTYGHKVGDDVLTELVKCVKTYIRSEDLIFRWGGEEFILIIGVSDEKFLFNIIDNLRQKVSQHTFDVIKNLTASFGLTLIKDNEDIDEAILRADKAMYEAKQLGRNQTVIK